VHVAVRVYVRQEVLNVVEAHGCILNDITHRSTLTSIFATAGIVPA